MSQQRPLRLLPGLMPLLAGCGDADFTKGISVQSTWLTLVATVIKLYLTYEKYRHSRREWFDWVLGIAVQAARASGEGVEGARTRARRLLGDEWKSVVWAQFHGTWTPSGDAEVEEILSLCADARMIGATASSASSKETSALPEVSKAAPPASAEAREAEEEDDSVGKGTE